MQFKNFLAGWGNARFDAGGRPTSLPPHSSLQQQELSPQLSHHRMSNESSSESEASGIIQTKKDNKEKDKKGLMRIFSKKKSKQQP